MKKCMCCYFDDVINFWDKNINFIDTLLDQILYKEKYKKKLFYDISYKTLTGAKLLHIRFDKTDGFIKIHHKLDI